MVNKRGQITVYIIIGLIALISLGVFMYMRAEKLPAEIVAKPVIEEVPTEVKPISDFVESCLYLAARDGLDRIGVHGGYTSWENIGGTYNPYNPTEGDGVEMFPDSGIVVPYWYYLKSKNDCDMAGTCEFATKRPELYRGYGEPSIEGQLDVYVDENIKSCLGDFAPFKGQGYEISEREPPKTRTTVTEESVAFYLEYPLRVVRGDTSFDIGEFFVDMPVRLKLIYTLATNITNIQANFSFAEMLFLNMVPIYSGLDRNMLPPMVATDMEVGVGTFWLKSEVKERVKILLMGVTPILRSMGTADFGFLNATRARPEATELTNLFMNMGTFVPTLDVYPGITADFVYLPLWEPYFQMICVGSSGEVCAPQSFSLNFALIQIGVQDYKNYYFLSYPLLVELADITAYDGGRPYTFNFFLEANVRKNRALKPDFKLEFNPPVGVASQFCIERMFNSPNMTLTVWDAQTREPLEGAQVFYSCGRDSCMMGQTDAEGKLTRSFPRCVMGRIGASKPGYLTMRVPLTTDVEVEMSEKVDLEPARKKDIIVKKIVLLKHTGTEEWIPQAGDVALGIKEEAIVMMERSTEDGGEDFSLFAEYCPDVRKDCQYKDKMIYPGTYNVEIILVTRKNFSIEPDRRCEGEETLFSDEECFYIPEEAIEFGEGSPFLLGGVKNEIYIGGNQLDNADTVALKAMAFGVDKIADPKIEDMMVPSMQQDYYQSQLTIELMPSFIKE